MSAPSPPLSAPVQEEVRRFGAGAVLSRAFTVWLANAPFFLGISLALQVPLLWLPRSPRGLFSVEGLLRVLTGSVAGLLVTGALIRAVIEQLRGNRPSLTDSLQAALRSFHHILATSLVATLAISIASLFLAVPGIIVGCMFYVALPVTVAERAPAFLAISRSSDLTHGYRWHIFGLLAVTQFLTAILLVSAMVVARGTTGIAHDLVGTAVPTGIVVSLGAVIRAVAYYQLRVVKEGVDIEQLAAVFD
jgi:hypothetical protein